MISSYLLSYNMGRNIISLSNTSKNKQKIKFFNGLFYIVISVNTKFIEVSYIYYQYNYDSWVFKQRL